MDLETFVAESLRQIVAGVKKAQDAVAEHGGLVGPVKGGHGYGKDCEVEFDVAVTAGGKSQKTGAAGLTVVGIKVGGHSQVDTTQEVVSRIRFRLYLEVPGMPRPSP